MQFIITYKLYGFTYSFATLYRILLTIYLQKAGESMINVLDRITHYRTQKGWTEYQLAVESGLTQSTISSWYRKQLIPSIPSLEKICAAFGITLAQFFSEDENTFALTPVQQHLIEASVSLTEAQMTALIDFLNAS